MNLKLIKQKEEYDENVNELEDQILSLKQENIQSKDEMILMEEQKVRLEEQLNTLCDELNNKIDSEKNLQELGRQMKFQIDELMKLHQQSEDARKSIKGELMKANAKIIEIEEQLYESKKIQAELLSELELAEDNLEEQIRENQGILDDNDALKLEADTAMNKIYYANRTD